MYAWPYAGWAQAGVDAWSLGFEASQVIGLRMAKIAAGGAASEQEVRRMIAEKVDSTIELQAAMLTGTLGATPLAGARKVLGHYRRKVRHNRRRLSPGSA